MTKVSYCGIPVKTTHNVYSFSARLTRASMEHDVKRLTDCSETNNDIREHVISSWMGRLKVALGLFMQLFTIQIKQCLWCTFLCTVKHIVHLGNCWRAEAVARHNFFGLRESNFTSSCQRLPWLPTRWIPVSPRTISVAQDRK